MHRDSPLQTRPSVLDGRRDRPVGRRYEHAVHGLWARTNGNFASCRIEVNHILTDHGSVSCHRRQVLTYALGPAIVHKHTLPYRPDAEGAPNPGMAARRQSPQRTPFAQGTTTGQPLTQPFGGYTANRDCQSSVVDGFPSIGHSATSNHRCQPKIGPHMPRSKSNRR